MSMTEVEKPRKTFGERLDDFIGVFSPERAHKRRYYRALGHALAKYRGAEKTRLRADWIPGGGSADDDLLTELPDLRERSRDLNRNDPNAAGITETITINDVGSGITPQSKVNHKILKISEEKASLFQDSADYSFSTWAESPYADAGNRMTFYDIQNLVDRQILENGESLIIPLRIKEKFRPYMLALQVVEGDRVRTPRKLYKDKAVRSGIRIGERGQALGCYVQKTHPGDRYSYSDPKRKTFQYIKAFDEMGHPKILHIYFMKRPGQTRGVPFFAPVLDRFKDLADYLEAEVVAARVAACFALFVKKFDAHGGAIGRKSKTQDSKRIESMSPGIIEYLEPGEEIQTANPNRQSNTFDPFVERILRMIGASLQLPYEIVAKDFSKTNYSSARAALLQAYKYFKVRQKFLSVHLCQPVWELLLEEAYLKNELACDDFLTRKRDWSRCLWVPDGWEWVDPIKEVKAAKEAISSGLSNYAIEYGKRGMNWEDQLRQCAREREFIKDLALELDISEAQMSAAMEKMLFEED